MNRMNICKACGVELEADMTMCPLCGTSILTGDNAGRTLISEQPRIGLEIRQDEKHLLQRILWQVTSILLLSGIAATLIIDFAINKEVTWSVYPVTICVIAFSYVSVLALWRARIVFQLLTGWLISSVFLILLASWLENNRWTIQLALPILFSTNLLIILLVVTVSSLKKKGLNVLALTLVAIAMLCLAIEGSISFYLKGYIRVQWSVIVAACLLPVTAALFFMYFKTRKSPALQKIFHT